jgi:hypothetical protein
VFSASIHGMVDGRANQDECAGRIDESGAML